MKEINTIQKQTKLITAIFNLSKLEKITTNSGKIQNTFYKLKQEFPEYFKRLMFDTNGHIPYSNNLGEILGIFRLSDKMQWDGFKYYKLIKDKEGIKELKKEFPKDISEIKNILSKFDEYISS